MHKHLQVNVPQNYIAMLNNGKLLELIINIF